MASAAVRAHRGDLGLEPAPLTLRHALAGYPTGITLVTAESEGRTVGMLANSFTSVSLEPPLVSVAFARTSSTWPALQRAETWGISVLGRQHADLIPALSRPAADRFDGIELARAAESPEAPDRPDAAPVLPDAVASLTVSLHTEIDAGDHVMALLRVRGVHRDTEQEPLVFYDSRVRHLSR